jgi:hypothetical protein
VTQDLKSLGWRLNLHTKRGQQTKWDVGVMDTSNANKLFKKNYMNFLFKNIVPFPYGAG